MLFVANAADTYDDKFWVELDKKAFEKAGFHVEPIDLRKLDKEELKKFLNNADIFHVCGGSVLYLLNLLRQRELVEIIRDFIRNGKMIYTGTSAGSMIAASDLSLSKYDEEEQKFVFETSDYSGLDLVNFYIIPHCQNHEFLPSTENMIKHLPDNKNPILMLNDNQAVWVKDENFEILSSV